MNILKGLLVDASSSESLSTNYSDNILSVKILSFRSCIY